MQQPIYDADEYNPDEDLGNMDHFEPDLRPGSDHDSDDDLVTPPMYNSDEEQDEVFDSAFFANVEKNRMSRPISDWCSCGHCSTMESENECVCCAESMTICRYKGELKCVTDGVMFKSMVLSEEGLRYSRFLFAMTISDPERKEQYLKAELTSSKWRYLAYRSFINLLASQDLDRRIRYVLPSCVVSAVREAFPNTDGARYTGFVNLGTDEEQALP